MYLVLVSKKVDFSPDDDTRYTFPSGEVATYSAPFASNAIACASRSVDSNTVFGFPEPSNRNTFAGEPPAAYKTPAASARSDHKYDASASAIGVNFGASSR